VPTIQGFLEDFFIKNWKAKLVAFALVAICWLVLASHQTEERKQMTQGKGQKTEDMVHRADDSDQKTEDRTQRTVDGRQNTDGR
jgi:hypothetical protein